MDELDFNYMNTEIEASLIKLEVYKSHENHIKESLSTSVSITKEYCFTSKKLIKGQDHKNVPQKIKVAEDFFNRRKSKVVDITRVKVQKSYGEHEYFLDSFKENSFFGDPRNCLSASEYETNERGGQQD